MSKQKINEIHKNKQPKKKKKHKWFTLVELIVVITILAILWTIAFISFQSYNRSARDWVRLSDLNNIEKSLWLFIIEKWRYPEPDLWVNVTYSWWLAWTQWTVWDKMMTNLVNINKKPVDPLTGNEYTYSVTSLKNEYQVWAIQEIWLLWSLPITKTYAATLPTKKAFAIVKWTYNEVLLKVNTGSTDYILAVPSIINSDINDLDLLSIITKKLLVHNNFQNLPYSYNWLWYTMTGWFNYVPAWNIIQVFSWSLSTLNWDTGLKKEMIDSLKQSYNWTIIWWDSVYTDVIKLDTSDLDKVELLANNLLWNWLEVKNEEITGTPFINSFSWALFFIKKDNLWNIYVWWNDMWEAYDYWYVAKYDKLWNQLWKKSLRWTSYECIYSMEVDNDWNVYAWGEFRWTINLWSWISITSQWNDDWYLIKLDTNWNPLWAKNISTSYYEYVYWVKLDWNGNVYINWVFSHNYTINFWWWISVSSVWSQDWFLAKYNSNWVPLLAKKIWWTANDWISKIFFDSNWNNYIFWSFQSTNMNFWSWIVLAKPSTSEYDWYLVKYDSNWSPLWAKKVWSTTWSDSINNAIIDSYWNIYIIWKFFWNVDLWAWITISSLWLDDSYIAKYDSNWTPLWAKSIWWVGNDSIYSLLVGVDWNPYISGWFNGNVTIWWVSYTSRWSTDSYIVKYDSEWSYIWSKQVWWIWWDSITNLLFDSSWKLLALGSFSNSISFDNWFNVTSNWSTDWLLIKYDIDWNINSLNNIWWTWSESISKYLYDGDIYIWWTFNGIMNFSSKTLISNWWWYWAGTYGYAIKINKYLDVIQ